MHRPAKSLSDIQINHLPQIITYRRADTYMGFYVKVVGFVPHSQAIFYTQSRKWSSVCSLNRLEPVQANDLARKYVNLSLNLQQA